LELTKHFKIRSARQPCSICNTEKLVIMIQIDSFHIIQAKVRFGRIIQLIRNDPRMMFPRIKLFEDKSCDLTIQVSFSAFAVDFNNL